MARKIVIVGAGIAGVSCAEYARKTDADARIYLFNAEKYLPYYRIRLSACIGAEFSEEEIKLHGEDWYRERNIILKNQAYISHIDLKEKYVLCNNEKYAYDSLVLTQGAFAFIPPLKGSNLDGVFAIRFLDDVKKLNTKLKESSNCVIIGGGVLGLEAAWAVKKAGKNVTVIEHNDILLNKQLDEEAAKILHKKAEESGLKILLGKDTAEILGEEKVNGVLLTDGTVIPAETVIFSTGIRPNLNLLTDAGVEIKRNIVVNERMETNIPGVFAAGDIAEYNGQAYGIWPVAQEQGKVAGINAAGGNAVCRELTPSNNLMVFGTAVFSAGNVGQNGEKLNEVASRKNDNFKKLFFKEDTLVGAIMLKDIKDGPKIKKLLAEGFKYKLSGEMTPEEIINAGGR